MSEFIKSGELTQTTKVEFMGRKVYLEAERAGESMETIRLIVEEGECNRQIILGMCNYYNKLSGYLPMTWAFNLKGGMFPFIELSEMMKRTAQNV